MALGIGLESWLDFRLVLSYDEKERILDQDELLFTLMGKFKLDAIEKEDTSK